MHKIPHLPKQDRELEDKMLAKLRTLPPAGKRAARLIEVITLSNMLEAVRYLRKVCKGVAEDSMLISASYRGFLRAMRAYKPGRIRFFAYAKQFLRGELANDLSEENFNYRRAEPLSACPSHVPDDDKTDDEEETVRMGLFSQFDFSTIFNSERLRPVMEVIKTRLSERERLIILMKYEGGRNFQQIADLLCITRSAAQATHHRALEKIRIVLRRNPALLEGERDS